MAKTLQEQKKEILEKGIQKILEESSIPQRMHLQMLQALREELQESHTVLTEHEAAHQETLQESKEHFQAFKDFHGSANGFLDSLEAEVDRLTTIDHLKGDPGERGKDAKPVDTKAIVEALIPYIPAPLQGKAGKDGENAEIDVESLVAGLVDKIRKEQLIDISDIRNSQSFLFNKKRYKFEELMRGAGGGSTSSGQLVTTQYLLAAVQAGSNVTIDLTQLTNWATFDQLIAVYRNNFPQTLGIDFSIAGNLITINGADASEIFNATYAYS